MTGTNLDDEPRSYCSGERCNEPAIPGERFCPDHHEEAIRKGRRLTFVDIPPQTHRFDI